MKYILAILISISIFIGYFFLSEYDFLIMKNSSLEAVTNVHLVFSNQDSIFIGNLYPSSLYRYKLIKSQNETTVSVVYTDSNRKIHESTVISYLILGQFKNYEYEIK